jgi:tetratricopeptide (TPR) repeat protein
LATRLGNLATLQGRFVDAAMWHAVALSRARELAFPGPAAQALSGMAVAAVQQGRLEEAEHLHREALAAYERVGSVEGAAFTLACLGFLAADRGDAPAAVELHRRSLCEAARGSERRATALALEGLAAAHLVAGDAAQAARLLGAAAELRGAVVLAPWLVAQRARTETSARSVLGDGAYERAHGSGRRRADAVVAELVAACDPNQR